MKYTKELLDRFNNLKNMGTIEDTMDVGRGVVGSILCGDKMSLCIFVDFRTKIILNAKMRVFGCHCAIACGDYGIDLIIGKSIYEVAAKDLNKEISDYFKLPKIKQHCSCLFLDCLVEAVKDYANKNNLIREDFHFSFEEHPESDYFDKKAQDVADTKTTSCSYISVENIFSFSQDFINMISQCADYVVIGLKKECCGYKYYYEIVKSKPDLISHYETKFFSLFVKKDWQQFFVSVCVEYVLDGFDKRVKFNILNSSISVCDCSAAFIF